ncbi:hypothetical protein [Rhodosalinus sp. K401]|uniref:hypothetical protein n=1 Tax=Rhodosalinus sp. K401 TaxID=3239195 RepID=UPI003524893C
MNSKTEKAISILLDFAAGGEFVSELNGYEADERDIPGTNVRVVRILHDYSEAPRVVRLEQGERRTGEAFLDMKGSIEEIYNADALLKAASMIEALANNQSK